LDIEVDNMLKFAVTFEKQLHLLLITHPLYALQAFIYENLARKYSCVFPINFHTLLDETVDV